jgi:hypothetical protein
MHEYLSSVSLADLVEHQSGKHVAVLHDRRAQDSKEEMAA